MKDFKKKVQGYNQVYLQIHNNPDPDAVASGYGMQRLLQSWGIDADIIYYGPWISKPNLTAMVKTFNIRLRNITDSFKVADNDLVIILDGQAGASNVFNFGAINVMCIDHHLIENGYQYVYRDIQPKLGSCSTLVTRYLLDNNVELTSDIATCLYFGMLMDTDNFITKYTNMDRDCRDILDVYCNKLVINRLVRSSLSFEDMKVCAEAMSKIERHDEIVYSHVGECDDNLLGHMSDMLTEIEGVHIVVIYSDRPNGYKLSIRSYHDYVSAEDIIVNLCDKIGSGGGHINKAGGFILKERFKNTHPTVTFDTYVKLQTVDFCKSLRFFIEGTDDPIRVYGEENFRPAKKKPYSIRYIELDGYFAEGERISIKTLEGNVEASSNNKLIVGAKGEIYPITNELFDRRYKLVEDKNRVCVCDSHIDNYGIVLASETNVVKIDKETLQQKPIAETTALTEAMVKRMNGGVKVRTKWGEISLRGKGFLVYIDKNNFYLCDEDIFYMTYQFID